MKLPLVATLLGIVAFKLMVATIVILSILPLLTGGIGLDFDGDHEGGMTFENGIVRAEMPVTVRNEGFFDIKDLAVTFTFMNEEGDVLAVSEGEPMDIPAGRETDVSIALALDLYDLDRKARSDLIFNGTEFVLKAKISAKYTLDMVRLSVEASSDMGWGPFISDLQVETWNAQPQDEGGERYVKVPFSFRADEMFQGLPAVIVNEYWDESGYRSNSTQTVYLSQQVNEMASIPLSQEAYDRLLNGTANAIVRTTLFFLDCSTYNEGRINTGGGGGDPIYNIQVETRSSYLEDLGGFYYVVVPYSFRTAPAYQGQQAQVLVEYWDSHGFYGQAWQMSDMWDYGWGQVSIWLAPEAYDVVYYGEELVQFKVTIYYQYWTGFSEHYYYEPWGVGA